MVLHEARGGECLVGLKDDYLAYVTDELQLLPSTARAYERRIGYLERRIGKPLQAVTSDDLREFKRAAPSELSSQTISGFLTVAREFHVWGSLEGLWPKNGISDVRGPRILNEGAPPLSIDKALRVAACCRRPLEYRVVFLPLYAGMRIGEAAAFGGEMWLEDDWLRFRGEKTQKIRRVPVHPNLRAVKWKVLASPPTHGSTLQRVKRRLEERSGVRYVTHQLRKTFMTTLYDVDVDDRVVKELVGHQQDVSGRYIVVSDRKLREAINALPY